MTITYLFTIFLIASITCIDNKVFNLFYMAFFYSLKLIHFILSLLLDLVSLGFDAKYILGFFFFTESALPILLF